MRRDKNLRRSTLLKIVKTYLPLKPITLEIGVAAGDFSEEIINFFDVQKHFMVDPWELEGDSIRSQWFTRDNPPLNSYKFVLERFKKKPTEIIKDFSSNFFKSSNTHSGLFDFIYVDGDHHSVPVYNDLIESYKILKTGGVLAGDDYNWVSKTTKLEEVRLGVKMFEKQTGLQFNIVKGDNGGLDQYYLVK